MRAICPGTASTAIWCFFETRFLVGALHFKHHVNSAKAYYSKEFSSMNGIPSILHERKDSLLHHLKDLAPLMAFEAFFHVMRFAVAFA